MATRLLLALVLCVSAVQFDRGPIDAKAPDASGPEVSAAPSAATHVARAKVDRACAIDVPPGTASLLRPGAGSALAAARLPQQPPGVPFSYPPLTPRPPPAA